MEFYELSKAFKLTILKKKLAKMGVNIDICLPEGKHHFKPMGQKCLRSRIKTYFKELGAIEQLIESFHYLGMTAEEDEWITARVELMENCTELLQQFFFNLNT